MFFLLWIYSSTSSLTALRGRPSVTPAGAVYWFFVPIAWFWMPLKAIRNFQVGKGGTNHSRGMVGALVGQRSDTVWAGHQPGADGRAGQRGRRHDVRDGILPDSSGGRAQLYRDIDPCREHHERRAAGIGGGSSGRDELAGRCRIVALRSPRRVERSGRLEDRTAQRRHALVDPVQSTRVRRAQ